MVAPFLVAVPIVIMIPFAPRSGKRNGRGGLQSAVLAAVPTAVVRILLISVAVAIGTIVVVIVVIVSPAKLPLQLTDLFFARCSGNTLFKPFLRRRHCRRGVAVPLRLVLLLLLLLVVAAAANTSDAEVGAVAAKRLPAVPNVVG